MTRYNKYGFVYDQIICEDMALPNATNAALTNTVKLDDKLSGMLKVVICSASVTTEIASAATIRFTPLFGTTATTCTVRAMGTIEVKEGNITLNNTAGSATTTATASWAAGVVIAEFFIPPSLCSAYKYMDINVATSGNESADKIEAYLVVVD